MPKPGTHLVAVYDEILCTDKDAAGTIGTTGHWDEQIGAVVYLLAPLSRHVIQAQVQLIQREVLLSLCRSLTRGILQSPTQGQVLYGIGKWAGVPGVNTLA